MIFNTLFFYIRTSNFGAEAERSYFFFRFEAENVLKTILSYMLLKTFSFRRFINFSIVLNKKKEVESQLRCSTSCIYHAIRNNIVNVKVFLLVLSLLYF